MGPVRPEARLPPRGLGGSVKLRMTNLTDEPLSTDIGNNLGEQIRVLLPPVGTVEVADVDPFYINLDKVFRREVFQLRRIAYCFVPEPDDLVAPPFISMTGVLAPARVASAVNVPVLAGLLVVDGVALAEGDRVLLTAQTDARQNLVYVAHVGAWTIARDLGCQGASGRLVPNSFLWVSEGGAYADTLWTLTTDAPIIVGTTLLTWTQFTSSSGGGDTIIFGADSVGATVTTRYLYPGNSDGFAEVDPNYWVAPRAGTLRSLYVRHDAPAGNGGTIVYRIRVNNIASLLSVSLASTATSASNLVNSVSVVAGDIVDLQVVKVANVGAPPRNVKATLEVA